MEKLLSRRRKQFAAVLAQRGKVNGATVEFLDRDQLHELIPEAATASGQAMEPRHICSKTNHSRQSAKAQLEQQKILAGEIGWIVKPDAKQIFQNWDSLNMIMSSTC